MCLSIDVYVYVCIYIYVYLFTIDPEAAQEAAEAEPAKDEAENSEPRVAESRQWLRELPTETSIVREGVWSRVPAQESGEQAVDQLACRRKPPWGSS